jgi:hypothetical protein
MLLLPTTLLLACAAQSALASTSKDTRLLQDPTCKDEAWILQQEGSIGAGVYWSSQSWMFQLRDGDGDGWLDTMPGIDAMSCPAGPAGKQFTPMDVVFSMDGSYLQFEDGDVLRMDPQGGLQVVIPEQEFLTAIQHQSGSFDLDAMCWQGDQLWFSVKDSLQSTLLGTIEDGDILHYDLVSAVISRVYTEADVQALVTQANGNSTAIGDVKALAMYPPTGELAFTVQAPSAHDATVFGDGQGGRLLPGWSEGDWAFQDASELDALTFLPVELSMPPILATDLPYVDQNSSIKIKVRHGNPNGKMKGLFAYRRGFDDSSGYAGLGAIFLDQMDHAYQRQLTQGSLHTTALDASGAGDFDWNTGTLPPQFTQMDVLVQALDVTTQRLSNPIVIRLR